MSWIEVKTHAPRAIKWWFNEYRRDRINMQPGYQRRSNLWTRWKKAHLIDSLINGFDVPKFYVADFERAGTKLGGDDSRYAVIDGKQRFEAIFQFLMGEYALNPSSKYSLDPSAKIGGLRIQGLRDEYPEIATRIEAFEPVVMSVATDTSGMIEELFVRLNSGISINGAERRNAMPGPVPPIVREITVHPFFSECVGFSTDRMQEFNLAAKLLMFEHYGEMRDTKARNLDAFVSEADHATSSIVRQLDEAVARGNRARIKKLTAEYESAVSPYKEAEEAVMGGLDALLSVFKEKDPLLKRQGAIPVYYWILRRRRPSRKYFREFLEEFEAQVMRDVRAARSDPDDADPLLLTYYNALRTSNDKASMKQRYEILLARHQQWMKS